MSSAGSKHHFRDWCRSGVFTIRHIFPYAFESSLLFLSPFAPYCRFYLPPSSCMSRIIFFRCSLIWQEFSYSSLAVLVTFVFRPTPPRRGGRDKRNLSLSLTDGDGRYELVPENVLQSLKVIFHPWDCSEEVSQLMLIHSNVETVCHACGWVVAICHPQLHEVPLLVPLTPYHCPEISFSLSCYFYPVPSKIFFVSSSFSGFMISHDFAG